jgi:phosphohistidine swiveling domain-containing protein
MAGARTEAVVETRPVLSLTDEPARRVEISGSKAASLAAARAAGIPIVPGFVITTAVHRRWLERPDAAGGVAAGLPADLVPPLREAWARLSDGGTHPLVVRSSSTVEDIGSSSMAGRFRSILDVRGWDDFRAAVTTVLLSAGEVDPDHVPSPMGVLVQRFLTVSRGGVLFGVDPVTGNDRNLVLEAVAGGPDALVSGRVSAQHYVLSRKGRLLSLDHRPHHVIGLDDHARALLTRRELRALAALADRAASVFGGPQDIEWAIDGTGALILLQSRPVTATGTGAHATGPVLGAGPLAETFPDPLRPLETGLWIEPLRDGVTAALRETRAVPVARLRRSPVVVTVGGRVAADLQLFGYVGERRSLAALLDPRPALRRLAGSWRVGRLRAVLPARADGLVREVDDRLASVNPAGMPDESLLDLLDEGVRLLRRLHREEVLAGTILPKASRTAAAVALSVLVELGEAGETGAAGGDAAAELIRRYPILLGLVPPAIGGPVVLPSAACPAANPGAATGSGEADLGRRERLRLRVRWVQEFTARVAWELGRRLALRGVLPDAAAVALLTRHELRELVTGPVLEQTAPPVLAARRTEEIAAVFAAPLPAQFRLTATGDVVPASRPGARSGGGVGAGGGRGSGPVVHGSPRHPPSPGDVLVVRELQPGFAAWLPGLAGLVAETGGTLSHLAILAREYGVPTVVAVHDALQRFPAGIRVVVDGSTGDVTTIDAEEAT